MRAKWILIGVAVLAMAAGAWWLNGARTYDAISQGSTSSVGADAERIEDDFDGEIARKLLRPGQLTSYAVGVRNDGGRTIEITGIGSDERPVEGMLTQVRVRMMPGEGLDEAQLVPFKARTLEPGEEATFMVDLRMPSCRNLAPNSSAVIDAVPVRFKVLVFDREQRLPLRTPIHITRGDNC